MQQAFPIKLLFWSCNAFDITKIIKLLGSTLILEKKVALVQPLHEIYHKLTVFRLKWTVFSPLHDEIYHKLTVFRLKWTVFSPLQQGLDQNLSLSWNQLELQFFILEILQNQHFQSNVLNPAAYCLFLICSLYGKNVKFA